MRRSTLFGALAMIVGAAAVSPLRTSLNRRYDRHRHVLDTAQIPTLTVARVASLGHVEWFADVLWINALLYYGEAIFAHNPGRYIDRYASVMLGLDPHFREAYLWAGIALTLRTTEVPLDDIRRAAGYLEVGLRRYPSDAELHMQHGATLGFELASRLPHDSDERRRARAAAAEDFRAVAALGDGPAWISLTAATFLVESGRPEAAVEALRDGLVHSDNADFRARIQQRLTDLLRSHPSLEAGREDVQNLELARRREYPYLPTTLYLFVGPRVEP